MGIGMLLQGGKKAKSKKRKNEQKKQQGSLHFAFVSQVQEHSIGELNSHAELQLQGSLRNAVWTLQT